MNSTSKVNQEEYNDFASKYVSAKRIVNLFRPYKWMLLLALIFIFIGAATSMATPFLLRAIIDKALPENDLTLLMILVTAMIGTAAISAAVNLVQTKLSTKVGQSVLHDLRVRLYAHLQSLSMQFFTGSRGGEIQSRITNDIGGLQELVSSTAHELARNFSVVIMTIVGMLLLDWRLALFSLTILPIVLLLSIKVGKMRERITGEQQKRIADMSSEIQETLSVSGIILSRTMGKSAYLVRKFRKTSKDVADLEMRSLTASEWQWQLIYLLLSILPALTLLLGGFLMNAESAVSIGTLVAMIALQEQLIFPLEELLHTSIEMRKSRALFARIFEYLDTRVDIQEHSNAITLDRNNIKGSVKIENVNFSYTSDHMTLSNISIDVPSGNQIAIVGATGSGKTTLGYLICRLYDVDSGGIYIDGIDIRDLSFQSLTDVIGVVSQEPYLLNATIAENLRFARPEATDEELIEVAKIAKLHDFIIDLPMGYQTRLGERGFRFSGGEKQRLSLARSILRKPAILILDEATSALDNVTEHKMSEDMASLTKGLTTITIAHRLSTIRNADQIIVLDNGKIMEKGSHEYLSNLNGYYSKLLKSSSNI